MADDLAQSPGENLERVQELTWALLDEQISDDEFEQLNSVLLRDDKSRDSYLSCIQLHADLMARFAGPSRPAAKRTNGPTVLGMLNADMLALGFQSPPVEDATS